MRLPLLLQLGFSYCLALSCSKTRKVPRKDSINTNYTNTRQHLRETKYKDLPDATFLSKLTSEFLSLDIRSGFSSGLVRGEGKLSTFY